MTFAPKRAYRKQMNLERQHVGALKQNQQLKPLARKRANGGKATTIAAEAVDVGEKMNDAREAKRFLKASIPPSSPTRIPAQASTPGASAKSQPPLNARQMHEEIVAQYCAKYGHPPELEHVMA